MVNITYGFKTEHEAATCYVLMKKYITEKGWEGDWVDMSSPYGITQRQPKHKQVFLGGRERNAPYIQMGGINATSPYKHQVSIRALTHLEDNTYKCVVNYFDEAIKCAEKSRVSEIGSPDEVLGHPLKNDDDYKKMIVWMDMYKHQDEISRRHFRVEIDEETDEWKCIPGRHSIVFDGYNSVKLYTDWC